MAKILLVDGNALFHRAFHALPLLANSAGLYTNAVYGFTKLLLDLLPKEKPEYLAIAFDHIQKTFRAEEFEAYKANRSAPPPELYPQMPVLMNLLKNLSITFCQLPGYEADDIIGTWAKMAQQKEDLQVVILTGDRDAYQLVNERVSVLMPVVGMSQTARYTPAAIVEKTGLRPDQIVDYKALRGDSSDNIPGVKGIGDKQAVEFLQKYQNLDGVYQHLSELTPAQQKKLSENKQMAYLSQKMATILCDLPIALNLEECQVSRISVQLAQGLFQELEFRSMDKSLEKITKLVEEHGQINNQATLF